MNNYSEDFLMTALCAWEAFGDILSEGSASNPFVKLKSQVGISQARQITVDKIAPMIDKAWKSVEDVYEESFDIDFVAEFFGRAEPYVDLSKNPTFLMTADQAVAIGREIAGTEEFVVIEYGSEAEGFPETVFGSFPTHEAASEWA